MPQVNDFSWVNLSSILLIIFTTMLISFSVVPPHINMMSLFKTKSLYFSYII